MKLLMGLLAAIVVSTAFGAVAINEHDLATSVQARFSYDIDYDRFLGPNSQLADDIKSFMTIFNEVEGLPTCKKVATSTLIHSCGSCGTVAGGDDLTEELKSTYATRVAVCQLAGANARIPAECSAFVLTKANTKKQGFLGKILSEGTPKSTITYPVYEAATERDLDQCRTALAREINTWTSYTSAMRDAETFCLAFRREIEKDEQLHLFKVLAETTIHIDASLRDSLLKSRETAEALHQIITNVRQFSLDIAEGRERYTHTVEMWDKAIERLRHGIIGALDSAVAGIDDMGTHAMYRMGELVKALNDHSQPITEQLAIISSGAGSAQEKIEFMEQFLEQNLLQTIFAVAAQATAAQEDTSKMQVAIRENSFMVDKLVDNAVSMNQQMLEMRGSMVQLQEGHAELSETVTATNERASDTLNKTEAVGRLVDAANAFIAAPARFAFGFGCALLIFCLVSASINTIIGRLSGMICGSLRYVALVVLLCAAGFYFAFFDNHGELLVRCKEDNLTSAERWSLIAYCTASIFALVAIAVNDPSSGDRAMTVHEDLGAPTHQPQNEKRGFWFKNPKAYARHTASGNGKWTV